MVQTHDNLFLFNTQSNLNFTSKSSGGKKPNLPARNRTTHGQYIKNKLNEIWKVVESSRESKRTAASLSIHTGTYLEFQSTPNFSLTIKSLENRIQGVKLLNVRNRIVEKKEIEYATVFVPKGKEHYFIKKAADYLEKESTRSNNPVNQNLIDSIENVQIALVEAFFPENHIQWLSESEEKWFEIWLSDDSAETENQFRKTAALLELEVSSEILRFPERTILLVYANKNDLSNLILYSPSIAEMRRAAEANTFFLDLENTDQLNWTVDAKERIQKDTDSQVVINILDTGIRRTHNLLSNFIEDLDMVAYNPEWDKFDNNHMGHGTLMAGIALYDDVKMLLESSNVHSVTHTLESSKILPDEGENEPQLYGAITSKVISEQIINHPNRIRVNCMAVTSPEIDTYDGSPSSWSAAVDEITSGAVDGIKKLMLISAGNIPTSDWDGYLDSNKTSSVENPGQSWNALTVGAYTLKSDPTLISTPGMNAIAPYGGISPSSKTSLIWDKKWPIKPEILFEGGNGITNSTEFYEEENFSSLTTYHDIFTRQFHYINATSESTAHASWMAAKIYNKYPQLWPETVRALMVHSAEWTDTMKNQFLTTGNKTDYRNLLRSCGYGVPNLNRALNSADNSVNLIIESELQPYKNVKGKSPKTNEMHIHELPWPKQQLLDLGETNVKLKVTLSYFIEPGPGEKGWKNQYRYPSSLLRFELNGSRNRNEFLKSINKAVISEDEEETSTSSNVHWLLGQQRNVGSIHSDTWEGTAAELATSNLIGVFPAVGWWRERKWLGKVENTMRYSLIVSLSTEADVDLYTPIYTQIQNEITI
ncbi:S8 family peptidase [Metasolibacillus meyeri]|uniref:S8 family peptidase n=1 Tax=Metasolibacillus meyeri TaxID=1071052 RepID=A0AAW9NSE5_9BACL|nr:S8 family peptidase [Metasolibacillus meyeri]MEC1178634.1 S8 family peptidase [Metasolibacillus meyeri]